jgi:hypothetical protein
VATQLAASHEGFISMELAILFDFKVFFLSTSTFLFSHFRSTSVNNAEQLHFLLSLPAMN